MDTQLKRGLVEICVLRVLEDGDSYGYRLIKDIAPHMEVSESTLYPVLRRLESAECLTVYSMEHEGRLRKYYKITESGKVKIKEFIDEWKNVMKVYSFIEGGRGDNDQK